MKTELMPGEAIAKKGKASMYRRLETVGGNLFLTNQRLIFESHAINVQTGTVEIPLTAISDLEFRWTKILNLIPVFPNTIAVSTSDGTINKFIVFGRAEWKEAIEAEIAKS